MACDDGAESTATAVIARYHPECGVLSWTCAGHPLPVLLRAGRATLLPDPPGGPGLTLGVLPDVPCTAAETPLADGDIVLLSSTASWNAATPTPSDGQFKLHGVRVETAGVEAVLAARPGVSAAAVAVRPVAAGRSVLVACVVPLPEAEEGLVSRLYAFAQDRLHGAMIPARCVLMDRLPLLPNGKVDRSSLPAVTDGPESRPGRRPVLQSQLWGLV
ncbi:SpoIIE family protein phosphatase [Streptomyces chromofuscus]|uniref:SpoIIE family protein phosphatase n=1 Tax=Streptomyces chromofuscus TaxID=42881 RepID=UPI001E2B1EBE|nr:SpoIIE family protein phosphatase [Streptomyces chromofuscus]